jgi:hypothetical protein
VIQTTGYVFLMTDMMNVRNVRRKETAMDEQKPKNKTQRTILVEQDKWRRRCAKPPCQPKPSQPDELVTELRELAKETLCNTFGVDHLFVSRLLTPCFSARAGC